MHKNLLLYILFSFLIVFQSLSPSIIESNKFFIQALIIAVLSSSSLFFLIFKLFKYENNYVYENNLLIKKNKIRYLFITSFVLILVLLFASRNGIHDYSSYLKQWKIINSGLDPWIGTSNAYLPVHNMFAPLIKINNSFPKIIFFLLFAIPLYLTSIEDLNFKNELSQNSKLALFSLFCFSPFCLSFTILYGLNDTIVSGLILFALYFSISKKLKFHNQITGCVLSLATMIKIYPLFIIPFFIYRERRIDFKFLASYISTTIFIFISSLFLWGKSTLGPILFAINRTSSHLSFFNFSRQILEFNIDKYSIYFMGIAFILSLLVILKFKIDLLPSVVLTLAIVLSFYKVGHQQFFLFFFAVGPLTIRYINNLKLIKNKSLFISYILWICFLNFYQTFYILSNQMSNGLANQIRPFAPLVFILFSSKLLFEVIKILKKSPNCLSSIY